MVVAAQVRAGTPSAHLTDAWLRVLLPSIPAAGYFTLRNDGAAPLALTGASIAGCGMAMLHHSTNNGGTETMQHVASVLVPPHGSIRFAPGGYHVMCMQPDTAVLKPGRHTSITLAFADGSRLAGDMVVRGPR